MSRSTTIKIHLPSLKHNARLLRAQATGKRSLAVIKADAYGHGLIQVAETLSSDVDGFAVAITEEAVRLREAGISCPILVMEGPHTMADLTLMNELSLWPVLHDDRQIEWFTASERHPSSVWLKVDIGMHRLGFDPSQLTRVSDRLTRHGIGHMTLMAHLSASEDPECGLTRDQLASWQSALANWKGECSLFNSGATRVGYNARSDWVRIGYALYGGHIGGLPSDTDLKAVMRLESSVLSVRPIKAGDRVGYGGHWVAQRDSIIAVLPVGYGDGYPWGAQSGTPIEINGKMAALAGRVSMDMVMVDVTDCGEVSPGMPAQLWGQRPRIDEVAAHCGSIGYELMTRLPARVTRLYETE